MSLFSRIPRRRLLAALGGGSLFGFSRKASAMTQAPLTLPTSGTLPGINLVAGVNDALATLASQNAGPAAPQATLPGLAWMDTARHVLNFRDEADSAWIPAIGFDQTAKTALLAAQLPSLAALRAAALPWPVVRIAGHTADGDGGEGFFWYDSADTTSADNGGTVIVNPATGWRYKRNLAGLLVTPRMFGAKGDTRTVTDGVMTAGSAGLSSATMAFTASDVGKAVTVLGAGAGGAALNATVSAYVSATSVTLSTAAATTVSAAGVSLGTNDTAALQAWADVMRAGNPGLWGAGRFKITAPLVLMPAGSDGVVPEFTTAGTGATILDGWALTNGQGALFLGAGNSQSKTQVARWNMTIDLGATANGSDAMQVSGVDTLAIYGIHARTATNALHLINNATGQYTEAVVGHHWQIDGCDNGIFFDNQTGGTNSFRSSGLVDYYAGVNKNLCLIGPSALPYYGPLKGTMWGSGDGFLIRNNSSYTHIDFDFALTLESPAPLTLCTGQNVWLRGGVPVGGTGTTGLPPTDGGVQISRGAAILVEEFAVASHGGQVAVLRPYKVTGATTAAGEPITIPTTNFFSNGEETGIELFVHISAPAGGTPYRASIPVKCASAAGVVNATTQTMAVNDQSGYGWPTFAVSGSNLTFTYSAAAWPAGMTYSYTVRQTRSLFT